MKDLEGWSVLDITRYNKQELLEMVRGFLEANDMDKLNERLEAIRKSPKFIESHVFPQ